MALFYIADPHINHQNIPLFEPGRIMFKDDIRGMNETIIFNWNNAVGPNDTVRMVGDFGIGNEDEIIAVIKRLNGHIQLWPGNHDHSKFLKKLQAIGVEIMPLMTKFRTHGISVLVSHYPVDLGERWNLFNIHGHIHSLPSRLRNQINVGVDQDWGLPFGQPIPEEMVIERIKEVSAVLYAERQGGQARFY